MERLTDSGSRPQRRSPRSATGDGVGRPVGDEALTNLVGASPAFLATVGLIRRISTCDATVLVQGETGTGKELAARAIHYLGSRRDAPFVPLNCGAIPESLVESELFGTRAVPITDARESRQGVIAQAEGGTLFLDEIEAMGARAAGRLAPLPPGSRVPACRRLASRRQRPRRRLEQRRPAGARCPGPLSPGPALPAEHPRPRAAAPARSRRRRRPPRRDVREALLSPVPEARHDLHPDTSAHLRAREWPGNVRELENLIHRAVVLGDGAVLRVDAAARSSEPRRVGPRAASPSADFREAKASAIAAFEKAYLAELLARTRGNLSLAARLSGKERSRLGKLVKKHGLAAPDVQPRGRIRLRRRRPAAGATPATPVALTGASASRAVDPCLGAAAGLWRASRAPCGAPVGRLPRSVPRRATWPTARTVRGLRRRPRSARNGAMVRPRRRLRAGDRTNDPGDTSTSTPTPPTAPRASGDGGSRPGSPRSHPQPSRRRSTGS